MHSNGFTKKRFFGVASLLAILFVGLVGSAAAQTTAFTYQGELMDRDTGVDTNRARMVFRLWDAPTGGHGVGSDWISYPVVVEDGIFTTFVDFGSGPVSLGNRWLEIGVDVSGGTSYEWLSPRQPLTPAPTAVWAQHGGDNPWVIQGGELSYTAGDVGIGTDSPSAPLHVYTDTEATAVKVEHHTASGYAISGVASSPDGITAGVYGETWSDSGKGVRGYNGSDVGSGMGVFGQAVSDQGAGVFGENTSETGGAKAVFGRTHSPTGFGGYFMGRGYFSGNVGIGTTSPDTELDVEGTVTTNGLRLANSPTDGHVLTSDAQGNGSWQPVPSTGGFWQQGTGSNIYFSGGDVGINTNDPLYDLDVAGTLYGSTVLGGTVRATNFQLSVGGQNGYVMTSDANGHASWEPAPSGGFELPYLGSTSHTSAAFKVTNSGTNSFSHAVHGIIDNASSSSSAAAGYFYASGSNGSGVRAYSDGSDALYARYNGTGAYAVHASTLTGLGAGYFYCTSPSGSSGYFESGGYSGKAIRAVATGAQAQGIWVETTGGESYAARFESPYIGLVAKGNVAGAKIYGDVDIYEFGTNNKIIELGKGLDYAEGFDITGGKQAAGPGTVLVIDSASPGKLVKCTTAYDRRVAGIVAGANGLGSGVRLGTDDFDRDVALAGRVYCNVITFDEDIEPGDLLTTASKPGYAMEVTDQTQAQGAVLGKAMEPLAAGTQGQILVLVTLQ